MYFNKTGRVSHIKSHRRKLYRYFLEPRSEGPDLRRRELILNILVCGVSTTAFIAFLITLLHHINPHAQHDGSFVVTLVFLVVVAGLWKLSRLGHATISAYIFIAFLCLAATQFVISWGFGLTAAELLYALAIVIAGVLLSARAALFITGIVSLLVLSLAYSQVHGLFTPSTDWIRQKLGVGDAVGYVAVFGIIGLVTWLANREIDRSLERARVSEHALEAERDNLEVKVAERTHDFEQAQLVRTMELQRFAEFGRLSAHLLHEVANPLTAASLNLEQLGSKRKPELVNEIRRSLYNLERYVEAARKQLRGQTTAVEFSVKSEIEQVMSILTPLAQKAYVHVMITYKKPGKLYGDPVRFSQLSANLILNAIEAYPTGSHNTEYKELEKRRVTVDIRGKSNGIQMKVVDFGHGILPEHVGHLFEPFYTTKSSEPESHHSRRGLGIGLAMVKQFVESDFRGSIRVESKPESGTLFSVNLHNARRIPPPKAEKL